MKTCPHCHAEVDDTFEICWKCQYSFTDGTKHFHKNDDESDLTKSCLRCDVPLEFEGNFKFHEGSKIGFFGNLFELFTNRESFDLYHCPKCGKVEFYLPGFK